MTKDSTTPSRARWWGRVAIPMMVAGLLALVLASGGAAANTPTPFPTVTPGGPTITPKPPTPTPPEVPVGGIVDGIPDSVSDQLETSGSGSNTDVLAGSIAGTVFVIALALSGGAWYLRRRVR